MDRQQRISIRRALISVSDKTGIVEFAQTLNKAGVELLSTGGTARLLTENGVKVTEVSDYTGFPEMMDGRVKTLHPRIHGGILGRRGVDNDIMARHDIPAIDLVVVNLYPFQQVTTDPQCDLATAIENIDIGGPTLLRAAAKNHATVTVIVNTDDYAMVAAEMKNGGIKAQTRFKLAVKAYGHTAQYDGAITNYLSAMDSDGTRQDFPQILSLQYRQKQTMRYGENPHQHAAFYVEEKNHAACIANTRQLQGKELSYNNIADTDAALECVKQFSDEAACVIVKHANPCGVAVNDSLLKAYDRAHSTDPESAFGGIIAFNRELDEATALAIVERQFVEVIIAPDATDTAQTVLSKKQNVRVLVCGEFEKGRLLEKDFKRVAGGMLVQDRDDDLYKELKVVSKRQPDKNEMEDLLFTWKVAKFVKSNAIVYGKDNMTIGVGAGQMSRVNSARIARTKAEHAGLEVRGSVMASDAFFPFSDAINAAAEAGIVAIIQPGGSMRDNEVIAAADEHSMAMVFTGMRHFRH